MLTLLASEYQVQIIFDPALDVFLWAILLDRKEMAEVLLEHLRVSFDLVYLVHELYEYENEHEHEHVERLHAG